MNFGIKVIEILHPEKIEFAFEFDGTEATGGELRGPLSHFHDEKKFREQLKNLLK